MAEIRIRYDDDSDRMPYAEIAEIAAFARAVERNGWTGRFA